MYTLDIPPEKRHTLPERGWDRTIDDRVIGELYRRSPHAGRIEQILCDSRALDTAPYAGSMDFVFIDASHDYESVVNDTRALDLCRGRGVWRARLRQRHPGVHATSRLGRSASVWMWAPWSLSAAAEDIVIRSRRMG